MPRWKFDGRQQDAAEFLSFLLQGNTGTLQPVNWQGRTDGIPEVADQALTLWSYRSPGYVLRCNRHVPLGTIMYINVLLPGPQTFCR